MPVIKNDFNNSLKMNVFLFSLTMIRLPPNRLSPRVERPAWITKSGREKRVSQNTSEKITGLKTDEQIFLFRNQLCFQKISRFWFFPKTVCWLKQVIC